MANWVKLAWDAVETGLIKRAFKCCGVSVEMDGSEDEFVFDYDWVEDEFTVDEDKENRNGMLDVTNDIDVYEEDTNTVFENMW